MTRCSLLAAAAILVFSIGSIYNPTGALAQTTAKPRLSESLSGLAEWRSEPQGLFIKTATGNLRAVVFSPTIIRIRIAKDGSFDDQSFAVVVQPQAGIKFTTKENPDNITLSTDALDLVITKNPVRVRFFTKKGELLNEDEPAFGTAWIGHEVTTYKRLLADEKFIGLGEKSGDLNRRGSAYTNWNTDAYGYGTGTDPLYSSTPFYIGVHGFASGKGLLYGIFLDNSYKTHFNFGASNDRYSSFTAEDGEMNYYFIHRPSVGGIVEDYTLLTGRTPLPPLWSLGYHQCRYSYFPDKEVITLARTFREKKIPCDVIWFDIHYMDAYKVFTWNAERFPQPKQMLKELETMGFKNVVITDPGIKVEKGYQAYEDGLQQGIFVKYPDGVPYKGEVWPGWCHFPDFTSPKGRAWWGDKIKSLAEDGIDGFWTDMNEPATWGQHFPDLVEFDYDSDTGGAKATHKKAHNVFGMQMARATYEGAKKYLAGKRPFVLTRASFSGIQRYSAVWTGDNTASDDQLLLGVRLVTSMGVAGIPMTGMDVGGFNGSASRDLFARWMQVGAFMPFFRVHAAVNTKEQDPWSFGEDVEEMNKNYISLRYTLLPYLYSTFYESTQTGIPVARSLTFEYPFDDKIYNSGYQQQYMFGPNIMVAPVVSQKEFAKIYLPPGEWYDAHTDIKLAGKQEVIVETPLEKLPLYIKGGSVLPAQSLVQSTAQQPDDVLTVHIYNGSHGSEYVYYEDDGETFSYQNGDFYKRKITFDPLKKKLTLAQAEGKRASKFKNLRLVFHGFDVLPEQISAAGKKVSLQHDAGILLKPISSYDPQGLQSKASGVSSKKAVVFPNMSENFTVQW